MIPGNANPLMLLGKADPLDQYGIILRALRLRASSSSYLSRTYGVPSSTTKCTLSLWIKGSLGAGPQTAYGLYSGPGDGGLINVNNSTYGGQLFVHTDGGSDVRTVDLLRDPAQFYHVLIGVDTTQAVAADRIKIELNGVRQPFLGAAPAQNSANQLNTSGGAYNIGRDVVSSQYLDAYIAHFAFIDGAQLTSASFGIVHPITLQWRPLAKSQVIAVANAGGNNSFFLPFDDATNTTTLCADASTHGNNWTANNISLTAGVTYDSVLDTPTSCYPTFNPLSTLGSDTTLSAGNLTVAYGSSGTSTAIMGTMGMPSGVWCWDFLLTASLLGDPIIGITNTANNALVANYPGFSSNGWGYEFTTGNKYNGAGGVAYGATATVGDVIRTKFNATLGTLEYLKQTAGAGAFTSLGVAFTGLAAGTYFPAVGDGAGAGTFTASINFGQQPLTNTTLPAGASLLNTKNLPLPAIPNPRLHMDVLTHAGNNTTQNVLGALFQAALAWVKCRSNSFNHNWNNSAQGANNSLSSSSTGASVSNNGSGYTSAFLSNGITVIAGGSGAQQVNATGESYVDYLWKGGAGPVANTVGSITVQLDANTVGGFSVGKYSGPGAVGTVGHGLPLPPKLTIVKNLTLVTDWRTLMNSAGNGSLFLNTTSSITLSQWAADWNSTAPNSTVVSVGTNLSASGSDYAIFNWCEVPGYSKIDVTTGNGSSDGTFVYCAFQPELVMWKNVTTSAHWVIEDQARVPNNVMNSGILPDNPGAETTGVGSVDFLSNGFKWRDVIANESNVSGHVYAYAAFAKNPFRYSNAH